VTSTPRRPSYVKKLAKQIPDEKKATRILHGLQLEKTALADYAIAIIGAELVNGALEARLLGCFRQLDEKTERPAIFSYEKNGPLADFSARIKIAYALKLFGSQTRDDLESIGHIRNLFAHHPDVHSFSVPEIAKECDGLHIISTLTILEGGTSRDPRSRYISAAIAIAGRLRSQLLRGLRNVFPPLP
jgi:DNA-binding MltR family transcriptional regulator